MVSIVAMYFGIFSYSLIATQKAENLESANQQLKAQLSSTPALSQQTYKKSVSLFEKIQDLKVDKKQDTARLEEMYVASVKNLSSNNPVQAEQQLKVIETEITKIENKLTVTPSPQPSGTEDLIATPSPTLSPSPDQNATASAAVEQEDSE